MRPALARFVRDYFGDSPPPEAVAALHAAILADRQATIGYIIRNIEDDDGRIYEMELIDKTGDAWELPTGLEDLLG